MHKGRHKFVILAFIPPRDGDNEELQGRFYDGFSLLMTFSLR